MTDVWVDFNDREEGLVPAKLDDFTDMRVLFGGAPVKAYDDDGNTCHAFVEDIDETTGWVRLAMKWDSFEPAPPKIAGQDSFIDA